MWFRRLLYPYLPERRVWMSHVVALTSAGFVTLSAFLVLGSRLRSHYSSSELPPEQYHSLPLEAVCLVPYAANQQVPEARKSDSAIVRLREYAPNCYELLYWGNPVRPRYAFSVQELRSGRSVLLNEAGEVLRMQPLPVPVARRRDGLLPQQPVVRLNHLQGRVGDLYAVRVAVHDASRGTVLCSEVYLISGTQK